MMNDGVFIKPKRYVEESEEELSFSWSFCCLKTSFYSLWNSLLFHPPDRMKDAVIAKLANQAADFYGDAFKQCQYKDNLPKVSPQTQVERVQRVQTPYESDLVLCVWLCSSCRTGRGSVGTSVFISFFTLIGTALTRLKPFSFFFIRTWIIKTFMSDCIKAEHVCFFYF